MFSREANGSEKLETNHAILLGLTLFVKIVYLLKFSLGSNDV